MYIDELVSWRSILSEVERLKQQSIELFHFVLVKQSDLVNNDEVKYARQLFGSHRDCTKVLGLDWNKSIDKIFIFVAKYKQKLVTKRNVLSYVAFKYDPLSIIHPSRVLGKTIYYELVM